MSSEITDKIASYGGKSAGMSTIANLCKDCKAFSSMVLLTPTCRYS